MVDPEAVTSRGWRVTQTAWDHIIELGPERFASDGPELIFLDDLVLATVPRLRQYEDWSHEFQLDGRPATLSIVVEILEAAKLGMPAQTRLIYDLTVDHVRLGPPGLIVGTPDRPAVGTTGDRRRRRAFVVIAFAMVGVIVGALLPVISGWLVFALSVLVSCIVGLAWFVTALLDPPRGMTADQVRAKGVSLGLALAAGLALGASAALGLTAGLGRTPALGQIIEDVMRVVLALGIVGTGAYLLRAAVRRRRHGEAAGGQTPSLLVAAIGALLLGGGGLLVAFRFLGPDPELPERDSLYLIGISMLVVGLVIVRLSTLMMRELRPPQPAPRRGVGSPPSDES